MNFTECDTLEEVVRKIAKEAEFLQRLMWLCAEYQEVLGESLNEVIAFIYNEITVLEIFASVVRSALINTEDKCRSAQKA